MGRVTGLLLCTIGVLVIASMVQGKGTRGIPGVDYPNYFTIPETSFSCAIQKYIPGFYADMETQCQAFHLCYQDRQESFLCPTGTVFNQEILACDPWYNFNCSLAPLFFSKNAGPAMAKAGKNIPMLLKLRSTQGRSKVKTPKKGYSKVSTPSETVTSEEAERDLKTSDILEKEPVNVSFKELAESSEDGGPDVPVDVTNEAKDVVKELPDYSEENEDIEENIVYDPVTDGYYMKYDQYEPGWQSDSEPVSNEFSSFYEYENEPQDQKTVKDEPFYEFTDEENEIMPESSDTLDLNQVVGGAVDETTDFSKRLMDTDIQSKRTRKRPLYVVVPDEEDEPEVKLPSRPRRHGSEANTSSEEPAEQTQNEPYNLGENKTDKPLTTGEFREAIYNELVHPYEHLSAQYPLTGCSNPPCTQTQESTQTSADESPAQQTEESSAQETDVQNEQPIDDMTLQDGYDLNSYVEENVVDHTDVQRGVYTNFQSDPYQDAAETSSDPDETFVVIPDELDMPSVVEVDRTDADDKRKQMYADDYSQYISSFESPEAFGSYPFRRPTPPPRVHGYGNYPEGWRRDYQHYLSNVRDRYYQNQHGYQMNQPAGYEHPYSSPESPYFYDDVYPSYPQQNGEAVYGSDYSNEYPDPASAAWVPASNEAELPDVIVAATGSPISDITEASLIDIESSSAADLEYEPDTASVSPTGAINQNEEKYYVFDFDEEEDETEKYEYEPVDSNDATKPDLTVNSEAELSDVKESYETVKQETLEVPNSNDTLKDYKPESEEKSPDSEDLTFEQETAKSHPELGMEEEKTSADTQPLVTESSPASEEPVTLSSAFERLAALKTKPQSPSLQSFDFTNDQTFMNNVAFPESMDFGPYGYGGQQYGMVDSTNTKTGNMFSDGESEQSRLSKLSAIQDRIRSVKKGKFGMFKKYMGSTRNL